VCGGWPPADVHHPAQVIQEELHPLFCVGAGDDVLKQHLAIIRLACWSQHAPSGKRHVRNSLRDANSPLRGLASLPATNLLPFDGQFLTHEDTAAFFNLVLGTNRSDAEQTDLVAFTRQL
jgi:hypothetical protein